MRGDKFTCSGEIETLIVVYGGEKYAIIGDHGGYRPTDGAEAWLNKVHEFKATYGSDASLPVVSDSGSRGRWGRMR